MHSFEILNGGVPDSLTELYLVVNSSSFLSTKRTLMCTRLFPWFSFVEELVILKSSIDESLSVETLTDGIEGNLSFFIRGRKGASE